MTKEKQNSKGITLIALVVTIVVLLILAGITIAALFGENGLIERAKIADQKTKEGAQNDIEAIKNLGTQVNTILNGGTSGENPVIPEGLEVGSEVTYSQSGTYNWLHKYCSSIKDEKAEDGTDAYDLLESGTGKDFNIPSWKVLSIDEHTGKVELVPSSPTTGTVYLGEAQGYNNAVKLLNEACSSLYGDGTKGIEARSINIEDIEDYMTDTAKAEVHASPYKSQPYSPYTTHNKYPVIYAQEKLAVINGTPKGDTGLDLSEQSTFIERTEGATITSNIGAITTATSIQPYQTCWATYMSTAFKAYDEEKVDGNYYNLIMPRGTSTTYWVASRCVYTASDYCSFCVRSVFSDAVTASGMCPSNPGYNYDSLALFPVVTLSSDLISGGGTSFSVKQ
ncbi:MAG: Tfp pilus assembly protein FimT/FimU [Clostridia bacterium]